MSPLPKKGGLAPALPRSITWEAPEFEYTPKGALWNAGVIGIAGLIFLWRLLARDFTGSLLAALAGFTFFIYSHKRPKVVEFSFKPTGVQVGRHFHPYGDLQSFWVFYHPPHVKEVSFRTRRWLEPSIHIPLGDRHPVIVRRYLKQYLEEEEHHYSIVDGLMRAIGF